MMRARLGPLGAMVDVPGTWNATTSTELPSTIRTTLGGLRKVQFSRACPRTWQGEISPAEAHEVGVLQALVDGVYGPPPWHWVDPWMARTNLLTPGQAACAPGTYLGGGATEGGLQGTTDGKVVGRHIFVPDPNATLFLNRHRGAADYVPVAPGQPVTASAYLYHATLSPRIRLRWVDRTMTPMGDVGTAASAGGARPSQVSVTATPPEFAIACYVIVDRSSRVALPAVTWTDRVQPWHPGQGAPRVIPTGLSNSVLAATPTTQLGSRSFTLTEVG